VSNSVFLCICKTKKFVSIILQGNAGIFVSVLSLTTKKVFSEFVEFKGIDMHAYALLLMEWQL
jgi:hypothetical protein